jgi:hypothetical protein
MRILENLLPSLCEVDYETGDRLLCSAFPGLKGTECAEDQDACDLAASLQYVFVEHRAKDAVIRVLQESVGYEFPYNVDS